MTENQFRQLALALPEAEERAHMNHPDFRAGGKIFASLGFPKEDWGMVKLSPEQQRAFVKLDAKTFQPCNGAWGRQGCTSVNLASAKKSVVKSALELAHEAVMAKAAPKAGRKQAKPEAAERRLNQETLKKRKEKVLRLVESLPAGEAKPVGDGHFSLEANGKRFGYLLDNHHGDERLALNGKAAPGVQATLTKQAPGRYHIPKYVGRHGWIGLWLDLAEIDWKEVKSVLEEAHGLVSATKGRKGGAKA